MTQRIPNVTGRVANSKKSKTLLLPCIALMIFAGLDIASTAQAQTKTQPKTQALPAPKFVSDNSVEASLNSRSSAGHNTNGTATEQQISNVLWATGKAPVVGSHREVYIAKKDGTYLYNPADHSLSWHSKATSGRAAFVLDYRRELNFDAGVAYMFAIGSTVAQWDGRKSQLTSCPKQKKLPFGVGNVSGITTRSVAISSDGSLPKPSVAGADKFSRVVANLHYTDRFRRQDLSPAQLSQVLWAGYGCTPHTTYNRRAGLTVPSAYANYYLTGKIYVVNQNGVSRYRNRKPATDLATRDHRLENLSATDVRKRIRSLVSGLPDAPAYAVICLNAGDAKRLYGQLEVGFAAGNMLLQASARGMGAYFNAKLTAGERKAVRALLGLPSKEIPQAIVSLGVIPKATSLPSRKGISGGETAPKEKKVKKAAPAFSH